MEEMQIHTQIRTHPHSLLSSPVTAQHERDFTTALGSQLEPKQPVRI